MRKIILIGLLVLSSLICLGQVNNYQVLASCVAEFDSVEQQWGEFSDPVPDEGAIEIDLEHKQVTVSCCDITMIYNIIGNFKTSCNKDECAVGYMAYSNVGQECIVVLTITPSDFIAVTVAVDGVAMMMFIKKIEGKAQNKQKEVET